MAHLTRTGNSHTPESTASLPSSVGVTLAFGPSVSSVCTRTKSASASSGFFPLTARVIKDAEAWEMAQPAPWKAMSSITPSASLI
ncbi:hypothetical protein D3C71_1993230 [compost metagenome]